MGTYIEHRDSKILLSNLFFLCSSAEVVPIFNAKSSNSLYIYVCVCVRAYIYIYIYIYIKTVLVVTKSLCEFGKNQVQYYMESAQYLG